MSLFDTVRAGERGAKGQDTQQLLITSYFSSLFTFHSPLFTFHYSLFIVQRSLSNTSITGRGILVQLIN